MLKTMLACVMCLGIAAPIAADDDDDLLAKFDGGIGVIGVSSGQGTLATAEVVNRNIVRGVQPAGQLWVIRALKAEVERDGHISVRGRGLLLGGGNNIGANAGARVFASFSCVAAATAPQFSTNLLGVELGPNGDFRIDDVLTPVPPADCPSPALLIRNANGQAWFAAGIPKRDEH